MFRELTTRLYIQYRVVIVEDGQQINQKRKRVPVKVKVKVNQHGKEEEQE